MLHGSTPMRVLVADDDEAIRTLLSDMLRDEGYGVDQAADGSEALARLEGDELPDLIVLDLMMPGVTGWDVLEALEESPRLASIPVVVLTAFDGRDDLPSGRPSLHKPVDGVTLLDLVHTIFEQQLGLAFALQEPPTDLLPRPSRSQTGAWGRR